MPRFIFKVLLLTLDVNHVISYLNSYFGEKGELHSEYIDWYKEVSINDKVCDLEITLIKNIITANYKEDVLEVDGIVYFLNPNNRKHVDYFDQVLLDIDKIKRTIPLVLIYYDKQWIPFKSAKKLLENLWKRHPYLEGFVGVHPKNFIEVLECLCDAMVRGATPVNMKNARLRFPILITLAKNNYKQAKKFFTASLLQIAHYIATTLKDQKFLKVINKSIRNMKEIELE